MSLEQIAFTYSVLPVRYPNPSVIVSSDEQFFQGFVVYEVG